MMTAVAGTVLIAAGAFWLSFTALADLARRSGIEAGQAWAWPLIVDGIIVVSTVAVVALAGNRAAWYPWLLLICGAGLSVAANSIHAIVAADADVPAVLAASVAAVPPLVLLAITHLTVILTRHQPQENAAATEGASADTEVVHAEAAAVPVAAMSPRPVLGVPILAAPPEPERDDLAMPAPGEATGRGTWSGREVAEVLRAGGWSNKKIARYLDVHPSTIGRWLPQAPKPTTEPDAKLPEEAGKDPEAAPAVPTAAVPENEEEPS
ncbi:DUF2637 domain-containing protein [Leucobacter luti]|uniref:DUF2637 domain-containing protein n=1 Tax=Leucobacter chromiireducens subsp. chromiireducens TaxID=660067 RepID=A0ABS1SSH8_9MICO|nr:DUF2637 domain-containing protein [Leucobacter chromiireducens subsp. chromiireducens]MBL3700810.1 DUF2637 domain-containing protein [Leucobacter luti]